MKSSVLNSHAVYWTLACLFWVAVPGWSLLPPPVMLLVFGYLLWRILAERYRWRLPSLLLKLPLVVVSLGLLFLTFGQLYGRRVAAAMLMLMLAMKVLELRKVRDARLLVSMSFFMASVWFLFLQNIWILFHATTLILLALHSLNVLQLSAATTVTGGKTIHLPARRSLYALLRLLLLALPLAAVLFVVFPRLASPLWGVPEAALDNKSGLSDEMTPGSIQNLFLDDSPAFRVTFEDAPPPRQSLYWRGPVLWNFDGRRWSALFRGYRRMPPPEQPRPGSKDIAYRIQLESSERRWLYALDFPHQYPKDAYLSIDYQLYSRQPVTSPRSYRLISNPGFRADKSLRRSFRDLALTLPAGYNPRSWRWVSELRQRFPTNDPSTNRRLIEYVLEHFNREDYHYSLSPPLLGRHSVDEFLFDTRNGFCEHYASSFTVLMRMAGIPARVVTGYQGGYFQSGGDYLLVRQSDAHAWVEVWLIDQGWVRVDPTAQVAPERILSGSLAAIDMARSWHDFSWLRGLRNQLDRIQYFWNNRILSFTASSQTRLLEKLDLDGLEHKWLAMLLLLPVLALLALTSWWLLRLRQNRTPDPGVRLYRGYLGKLEKSGFFLAPGDSATAVVLRLADQWPQPILPAAVEKALFDIATVWNHYRYATTEASVPELAASIDNALKTLTEHLRQTERG